MKKGAFIRILNRLQQNGASVGPFQVYLNDDLLFQHGQDQPRFIIRTNEAGLKAFGSLDENRLAECYIHSDIEIEGEFLEIYKLRDALKDNHWLFYWWNVYGRPFFFGQVKSDKKWISEHYDHGDDFYLSFLDRYRAYSHGVFLSPDEDLETGILRKLEFAYDACNIQPGQSVLDIGGGWGTFLEFAGKRGARVTSLTISKDSQQYMEQLIAQENLSGRVINCHFFDYHPEKKFDAIVNLGVTEHLPDYKKTISKYTELLKPGGRVYLDASAADVKYHFSTYINKYIYPGNPSPLYLPDYVKALAKSGLELLELHNDRQNYFLTAKRWCQNLERNEKALRSKYAELYRIFRLYLYGTAHAFDSGLMSAYRMVLSLPDHTRKLVGENNLERLSGVLEDTKTSGRIAVQ